MPVPEVGRPTAATLVDSGNLTLLPVTVRHESAVGVGGTRPRPNQVRNHECSFCDDLVAEEDTAGLVWCSVARLAEKRATETLWKPERLSL